MKDKTRQNRFLLVFESFVYSCGQMLLGLLLHPYRSMQLLVKNKVLFPFIFYPTALVLIFSVLLHANLVASWYDGNFVFRFFGQTCLFFCLYWQIALFYLWMRFSRAFIKH